MKTLFRGLAFGLSLLVILVALGTLLPRPLNLRAEASLGGKAADILLLANPIHGHRLAGR